MTLFGIRFLLNRDEDVGDREYIEGKVLAGDYFETSGNINNINDTIEIVPANGKTAFMIEAKITMNTNPDTTIGEEGQNGKSNDQVVADLLIDGVQKSKAKIGMNQSWRVAPNEGTGMGMGTNADGRFNTLGKSLVGNGVKKIEIKNVLDNGNAFAEMSLYVV